MILYRKQFQEWGRQGGKLAASRMTKAQLRARAKKAVAAREANRHNGKKK